MLFIRYRYFCFFRFFITTVLFSIFISATPVLAGSLSSQRSYKAALHAFKDKNYYSARLLFQEILNKDRRGEYADDAQYYIALTYYYEEDYKSALFDMRVLIRDYPLSVHTLKARYWSGEFFYYLKNYRRSLDEHRIFIKSYPESKRAPYAYYTIGYIYNLLERYDDAVYIFSEGLKKYPASKIAPSMSLQMGIANYNNKEYSRARKQFQAVVMRYQDESVKEAQLWIGKTYFAEGRYKSAIGQFNFLLKKHKDGDIVPDAKYHLSLCLYRTKSPEKAGVVLNAIIKDHRNWKKLGSAYFRRGQIYQLNKEYGKAAADYQIVVENYPQSEFYNTAIELMADSYQEFGKPDRALQIYIRLLNNFSVTGESKKAVLRKMANIYFLTGDFDESAKTYSIYYKEFPADKMAPEAMYMSAQSHYKLGMYDKSLQILGQLIKKYPQTKWEADVYYLYGEIYYSLTDYTKALQKYRLVIRKHKKHRRFFDSAMGVGWSYFELKQYARASDQFRRYRKVAKTDQQKAWVLYAIASCRYNLRDFNKSLAYYRQVIKDYPKEKEAQDSYFQIGWVYYRQNKFDNSRNEFDAYLKHYPEGNRKSEALYFRAWSHYHLGDHKKALPSFLECYKTASKDNPFKERAYLDYARTLSMTGKHWDSIDHFRKFLSQFPQSIAVEETYYMLASGYLKVNQPKHAEKVYAALAKKKPDSLYKAEILRNISTYYRRIGHFSKADALYRKMMRSATTYAERMSVHLARIEMYAAAKKYDEAISIVEKTLKSNAEEMEPYRIRIVRIATEIYAQSGQLAKAFKLLSAQKKKSSSDPQTKMDLTITEAKLYLMQKKYRKVVKILKPLLQDQGFSMQARYYSALAYYYAGKNNTAFDYFRQVSRGSDEFLSGWAYYYQGEIQYSKNNYLKAARDYAKIVYLHSGNPDLFEKSLYKTALSFKKAGKSKEFNSYKEKLQESFPKSVYLKQF